MPPHTDSARRRALALAVVLAAGSALSACGSSPPVRLYRLPSAAPLPALASASASASASARPSSPTAQAQERWQLLLPVRIPDYLDRDALLLPQGDTGLLALPGHRWAEALRDAVPRVLREDLAALRGENAIWTSPLPAGVEVARRLRVQLLAFEAGVDARSVHLQARWTLQDARGRSAPYSGSADLVVPAASAGIDDLVAAHRLALWRLAERIAATP